MAQTPTTAASDLPLLEAIQKALQTTTNDFLAVAYLDQRISEIKTKTPDIAQAAEIIQDQKKFLSQVSQLPNTIWDGSQKSISIKNVNASDYNQQLAALALQKAQQQAVLSTMHMVYQVDDQSHFLRGYTDQKGQLVEANAQTEAADQVLQAWLVQADYICQAGCIYSTKDNAKTKADMRVFVQQFEDPTNGFSTYAKHFETPIQIDLKQQKAPTTAATSHKD